MQQITEKQIKEFAKKRSELRFGNDTMVGRQFFEIGYIEAFKTAIGIFNPPATKPLSEITDDDYREVAKLHGYQENLKPTTLRGLGYGIIETFLLKGDSYINFRAVDFLRSKGYILPTDKV